MGTGEKIAMVRKLRGLKQEALGTMIGTNQAGISIIEQKENISEKALKRIASALEVTPGFIKNFDLDTFLEMMNKTQVPVPMEISVEDIISQTFFIPEKELKDLPFDPLEKIIGLYKRLLVCQQEKMRILETFKNW